MKELEELSVPEGLAYTQNHEWAQASGDLVRVGITDFAQDQLGDVVYVELPQVGTHFNTGQEFGTVESVKAVSPLYLPLAGEVVEVNGTLEGAPELVNQSPYGEGWMVLVKPDAPEEWSHGLLSPEGYRQTLGSHS